jgi:hypothetical protein
LDGGTFSDPQLNPSNHPMEHGMEAGRENFVVPVGPGGIGGRIGRFVVFFFTAGFLYPNTCIEGMDCTKIQDAMQGTLYDKK